MRQKPHISHSGFLYLITFITTILTLINFNPGIAQDTYTINDSTALGVGGTLLATPPGSCTGVPNGVFGDCTTRATALLNAWVNGTFAEGTDWSDLRESAVASPISNLALPPPTLVTPTDIGTSWIPEYCNQPSCGHLLKGDVVFVDENGDGNFDETWIDDGDNIRETGEVDRLRADQFAWGATSTVLDFSKIGGRTDLQMVTGSAVTPPGLARARVRVALGDDWDCVVVTNQDCTLDGIPGVQDPTGLLTATTIDDNEFYATCDPDQWSALGDDLGTIQLKLDNCLWETGSFPTTAPLNAEITGVGNAIRINWVDERIVKYTASTTVDRQAFSQSWVAHYGFDKSDPIDEALYINGLVIQQIDVDPNKAVNLAGTPDTYDSRFLLFHTTIGRKDSAGKTNPTVDPFWNVDDLPAGYGVNMNTHADSGVGNATQFKFLYMQDVGIGQFLATCLNCGEGHDVTFPGDITYDQIFPLIPDFGVGNHPPAATSTFNIVP